MKKSFYLLSIWSFICFNCFAQNWVNLGGGLDFFAQALFADSISNKLYAAGNFGTANGHHASGIAAWDGITWDTLNGGLPNVVTTVTRYQNYIYVGGAFTYLHAPNIGKVNGFTRWNGASFDSVGTFQNNYDGIVQLVVHNNLLYCFGNFDSINNVHTPLIAAWDEVNCIPIGFNLASGIWEDMCFFQNELYIAGNFVDSSGTVSGCAKWDGNTWIDVGGNFGGLIHAMAVYHNELYFGGNYLNGPNSYLVKYDGTNISQVGSGFHGNVWGFRVIDDKLFTVGIIDTAGGIPVSNIAVWDGNNWSAFSNDIFNGAINDIAVFNGELYVTGGFSMINSDSVHYIAKYNGWHLGEELPAKKTDGVKIYPNPVSDYLEIETSYLSSEKKFLRIYNMMGEEKFKSELLNLKSEIDVSKLARGIYIAEVRGEKSSVRRKFVKE